MAENTVEPRHILIVEDDPILSRNVREAFLNEGFQVSDAVSAEAGALLVKETLPDLIVLDVQLGRMNGFQWLRELRKDGVSIPVILLTAYADIDDKVEGYDSGADDYLTKPFYMKELSLRVRALLQRNMRQTPETREVLVRGDLELDPVTSIVTRQGTSIELTPREFQILRKLVEADGELVPKKELIREIWGRAIDINTNTIEVYINFLRKKIDKPFGKDSIRTRIGYGYYFE